MNVARKLLAGAAATVLMTGVAAAADIIVTPPAAPPALVPVVVPGSAFAGPYFGVFGGYDFQVGATETGIQYGFNLNPGNFLAGFEISANHITGGSSLVDARLTGRAGVVLGDRVLLYGEAGLGTKITAPVWTIGGGIEVALAETLSVFAEAERAYLIGGGFAAPFGTEFRIGWNLHPASSNTSQTGAFDFAGFYMGTNGGRTTPGFGPLNHYGVQAGYNFTPGRFLAGVEVEATHSFPTGLAVINAAISARVGAVIGDRVLVYGELGLGSTIIVPNWTAGGGVEVALGQRFSVFGEGKAMFFTGGGYMGAVINGGVNVHFGR